MGGRIQSAEALKKMLSEAYAERAYINQKIVSLEDALREASPDYRKLMEKLET